MVVQCLVNKSFSNRQIKFAVILNKTNAKLYERVYGLQIVPHRHAYVINKLINSYQNKNDLFYSLVHHIAFADKFFIRKILIKIFVSIFKFFKFYPILIR